MKPLLILALCLPLAAQDRAWKPSAAAMLAASTADYVSSIGRQELNPLLRGADGRFSPTRGLAWKGGQMVALIIAEAKLPWLKQHKRVSTLVNFAVTGAYTYGAIHNARRR